jgi:inorganic pyrophosphatase
MSCINNEKYFETLEQLIEQNGITLDRPKGTAHPRFPDLIYPIDYGYINGTTSQDSGGIDVIKGNNNNFKVAGIICSVDIVKKDSEIKVLFNCTEKNIKTAMMMFNNDYLRGILFRRKNLSL